MLLGVVPVVDLIGLSVEPVFLSFWCMLILVETWNCMAIVQCEDNEGCRHLETLL